MTFIHFGFVIAGAAAMTLPIWIHLLLRQRARPMEIGSIRFVKNVVRRTKSRQRIQRWLLLALRALAVLLLGLLFARPFLPDSPADGRTREVAILIDRSASMGAQHENGKSAIEVARQMAEQHIAQQGEQARIHVALFDASGVESISTPELSGARWASNGTNFEEAFAWATDLLGSSERKDRSLLVLSDLQRRGVDQLNLSSFPLDIPVHIEDPAPAVAQNLAIEDVSPVQVEIRPGVPIAVAARLYNSGAFPIGTTDLELNLRGPAGKIAVSRSIALAAGQRKTVVFECDVSEPGIYQGVASFDRNDPWLWDNQRYIAFEARHPDRLLLIDGDTGRHTWENATYFLETALRLQTPVGEGPARTFEVERLVWDRGSGFPDLAGFRLIVLANIGRFTQSDADRLNSFVRDGGNVLWFAGERTTEAVLAPVLRLDLLGQTRVGAATDVMARVDEFDPSHPALAPFVDPQQGNLRSLSVRRLMPIESDSPDMDVLMRSRRWPLVVSHDSGKGRFVLVASSADRSWSDWPQNRLFVPLVRQLAAWLTGQLDARQSVLSEIIQRADQEPGITESEGSLIVRNVDPAESDLARLGADQFREAIGLPEESAAIAQSDETRAAIPGGVARPDEKWPILVWALLAVLGMELLLASRVHE